jgi:16S rRNA A1518/A1519 N6-dimethyltransferase RsmA/KsgA/DIM1 with predicted DNA glycosylase/AP lyase activity
MNYLKCLLKHFQILKKLLNSKYFEEGFIVIQEEASFKYGGEQLNSLNTMLSVIYGVEYTFEIAHKFSNADFSPIPKFNIVLLHIQKRKNPLVNSNEVQNFNDFVSYIFNRTKINIESLKELFTKSQFNRFKIDIKLDINSKPSEIKIDQYIYLFNFLKNNFKDKLALTNGYFQKIDNEQKGIEKIHRTRNDLDWRKK